MLTRQVTRLPPSRGSEQTSSALHTKQLLAKGTTMSEQNLSYMASLDAWSDKSVINILADAYLHGPEEVIINAQEDVRKAIRTKVLESYRNGQAAGPRKVFKRS
jgi:hypothetical protein